MPAQFVLQQSLPFVCLAIKANLEITRGHVLSATTAYTARLILSNEKAVIYNFLLACMQHMALLEGLLNWTSHSSNQSW